MWSLHLPGEAIIKARNPGAATVSPLWSVWTAVGSNHGGGMELRLISSRAALQPTEGPLNLSTVAMATACLLPPQYEIIWGTPAMDSTFSKMEFWKFPKGASSCSKGRDPGSLQELSLGQCPTHPSSSTPAMFHALCPHCLSTGLIPYCTLRPTSKVTASTRAGWITPSPDTQPCSTVSRDGCLERGLNWGLLIGVQSRGFQGALCRSASLPT